MNTKIILSPPFTIKIKSDLHIYRLYLDYFHCVETHILYNFALYSEFLSLDLILELMSGKVSLGQNFHS
jgi:hypothetical protein